MSFMQPKLRFNQERFYAELPSANGRYNSLSKKERVKTKSYTIIILAYKFYYFQNCHHFFCFTAASSFFVSKI